MYHKILFLITIAFLYCYVAFFSQPIENAVAFSVIDDGMYYPKIALNFNTLGVITYDGVTNTNGFHPLWLFITIALNHIVPDPINFLWIIYLFIFSCLIVSLFLLNKIIEHFKLKTTSLFLSSFIIFFNLRSFTLFFSFLESHLNVLIYLFILFVFIKSKELIYLNKRLSFIFGLLISLSFLIRLDNILFFLSIIFYWFIVLLFKLKKQTSPINILNFILGFLVFFIPVIFFNYYYFEHFSTVSSYVKFNFPTIDTLKAPILNIKTLVIQRISYILDLSDRLFLLLLLPIILILLIFFGYRIIQNLKSLKEFLSHFPEFLIFTTIHFIIIYIFFLMKLFFQFGTTVI